MSDSRESRVNVTEEAVLRTAQVIRESLTGDEIRQDTPIVSIWGAGASIPCGIPGGYYLVSRMLEDLRGVQNTRHYRDSVRQLRVDPAALSFEGILERYHEMYGDAGLHRWLRQFIPGSPNREARVFPTFAHEFAAHLAAKGALTTFISVNFDEVLEDALADELGRNRVAVITSQSQFESLSGKAREDWPRVLGLAGGGCVVLKPHGTISRRLTLRKIPGEVERFKDHMRDVLKTALQCSIPLLLGFGCYNEDFRLLFVETFAEGSTGDVVIVDPKPDAVVSQLPGNRATRKMLSFEGTADQFFERLEEAVWERDPPLPRQRPVRHRLRAEFFKIFSRQLTKLEEEPRFRDRKQVIDGIPISWFDERIYELELLIQLIKARGLFIDIVAPYCKGVEDAYRRCLDRSLAGARPAGQLVDLRPSRILSTLLGHHLFGSAPVHGPNTKNGLGSNWCFLKLQLGETVSLATLEAALEKRIRDVAEAYREHLEKAIRALNLGETWPKPLGTEFADDLFDQLKRLWKGFDVDVTDHPLTGAMRFREPHPLRTRLAFDKETGGLVSGDWDDLRLATVSAEWLTRRVGPGPASFERKLRIVSNLEMFKLRPVPPLDPEADSHNLFHYWQMLASMARTFRDLPRIGVKRVEWYGKRNLENHMTVCSMQGSPTGAIYFSRRGRTPSVAPLALRESGDLQALILYFDEILCGGTSCTAEQGLANDSADTGLVFVAELNAGATPVFTPAPADLAKRTVEDLMNLMEA